MVRRVTVVDLKDKFPDILRGIQPDERIGIVQRRGGPPVAILRHAFGEAKGPTLFDTQARYRLKSILAKVVEDRVPVRITVAGGQAVDLLAR